MEVQKKRIRKEFQPLSVAVSLKILSPGSPTNQVFDAYSGEFEPDRRVTPLILFPEVIANVSDGSWDNHYANLLLSELKWYVNGEDISTLSLWEGKYKIETQGNLRGAITISRNIASGENCEIHFSGIIADMRLGVNIPVKSDSMMLITTDKSQDSYSISIGESQIVRYNPFIDRLLIYDYQVANGIIVASDNERKKVLDENSYERLIPISVHKGAIKVTSGVSIEIFEVDTDGNLILIDTSLSLDIISLTLESLLLDLRMIEKKDYLLMVKEEGREKARIQFSVNRVYPSFTCVPAASASINPGETIYINTAMVECGGSIIRVPEPIIQMIWFTDSANKAEVQWQEGVKGVFELQKTGIGNTYLDDWIDIYIRAKQKKSFTVVADSDDVEYTDSNGNVYINN